MIRARLFAFAVAIVAALVVAFLAGFFVSEVAHVLIGGGVAGVVFVVVVKQFEART